MLGAAYNFSGKKHNKLKEQICFHAKAYKEATLKDAAT
jgi:hypothetical protein